MKVKNLALEIQMVKQINFMIHQFFKPTIIISSSTMSEHCYRIILLSKQVAKKLDRSDNLGNYRFYLTVNL